MIFNFETSSVYFKVDNWSGESLETNIPSTRDWKTAVTVTQGDNVLNVIHRTVVNKGNVVIRFETYLNDVTVVVCRDSELRPPLLQKIFAFSYATSWLDGFVEYLQDRAIKLYLAGQGRYTFTRNRTREWLPPVIRQMVTTIERALDFLFNKRTIGLISQCTNRPDKQAIVERPIFTGVYDNIEYEYSVPLTELSSIGAQDKNSGLKALAKGHTIVKEFNLTATNLEIKIYKAAFKGVAAYFTVPLVTEAIVFIGGMALNMQSIEYDGDITLSISFNNSILSSSRQPVGIKINGLFIPMRMIDTEPTLPLIESCGTSETGVVTTIADWVGS